jgi:NADP-dependent aldehyde dehydrogenase
MTPGTDVTEAGGAARERVDTALGAAAEVHRAGLLLPPAVRVRLLRAIAAGLTAAADQLVEVAAEESHLGQTRLQGELTRTTSQFEAFARIVDDGSWAAARIDPGPPDLRRMMWPIGPVVVFGASNFPLAFSTPGGDTASALAAGCPVVVKAHPAHPRTAERAAAVISEGVAGVGLPSGTFHQLAGDVSLGTMLVEHPETCAVAFTGSLAAGRALFDVAARRPTPIPVFAEMGSINPVFVLPAAMAERAADIGAGLADSVTLGAGQFCTNPGVVVAVDADDFAGRVAGELASHPAAAMLTPAIAASYSAGVTELRDIPGVEVLTGSGAEGEPTCALVRADEFIARPTLREEIFGPVTIVVSCADEDELLEVARRLDGQLTSTIHAGVGDHPLAEALLGILPTHAGRLIWNGFPTGVAVSPAMQHGGPYPASTDPRSTSVGTAAIARFLRPVTYQALPDALLPPELQDANPLGIVRQVGDEFTDAPVERRA